MLVLAVGTYTAIYEGSVQRGGFRRLCEIRLDQDKIVCGEEMNDLSAEVSVARVHSSAANKLPQRMGLIYRHVGLTPRSCATALRLRRSLAGAGCCGKKGARFAWASIAFQHAAKLCIPTNFTERYSIRRGVSLHKFPPDSERRGHSSIGVTLFGVRISLQPAVIHPAVTAKRYIIPP